MRAYKGKRMSVGRENERCTAREREAEEIIYGKSVIKRTGKNCGLYMSECV